MSDKASVMDAIFNDFDEIEEYVKDEFPYYPVTYQDIFDIASGNYFYYNEKTKSYERVSNSEMIKARKYISANFTGRSDPSLKSRKSRR